MLKPSNTIPILLKSLPLKERSTSIGLVFDSSEETQFSNILLVAVFTFALKTTNVIGVETVIEAGLFNADTLKIFGAVCIIYGLFRMYRGYKKKYFRDK